MTSSNRNIFRITGLLWWESTGGFPSQRASRTQSFDVSFDLRLNKPLLKQSRRRWIETPSCSLWRYCNEDVWYTEVHVLTGDLLFRKLVSLKQENKCNYLLNEAVGINYSYTMYTWWRQDMETVSVLLALCEGNPPDSPHTSKFGITRNHFGYGQVALLFLVGPAHTQNDSWQCEVLVSYLLSVDAHVTSPQLIPFLLTSILFI